MGKKMGGRRLVQETGDRTIKTGEVTQKTGDVKQERR